MGAWASPRPEAVVPLEDAVELPAGCVFGLADALAGQPHDLPDLSEGAGASLLEPVPEAQDALLAGRDRGEEPADLVDLLLIQDLLVGRGSPRVREALRPREGPVEAHLAPDR